MKENIKILGSFAWREFLKPFKIEEIKQEDLDKTNAKIILTTEKFYKEFLEIFNKSKAKKNYILYILPESKFSINVEHKEIRDLISKALGIKI